MSKVIIDRELTLDDVQMLAQAIQQLAIAESDTQLKPWLTVKETADYLQVSPDTVYELIYQGRIPAKKVGRQWRISRAKLMQALEDDDIYEPPYAIPRLIAK